MAKFEAVHVSISYTMRRTQKPLLAVSDVSFAIQEGEFVAIVGPSGCTRVLNAFQIAVPPRTSSWGRRPLPAWPIYCYNTTCSRFLLMSGKGC